MSHIRKSAGTVLTTKLDITFFKTCLVDIDFEFVFNDQIHYLNGRRNLLTHRGTIYVCICVCVCVLRCVTMHPRQVLMNAFINASWITFSIYHQTSNISRTLVGSIIADHSEVVGASPVGAAPTTSSFST